MSKTIKTKSGETFKIPEITHRLKYSCKTDDLKQIRGSADAASVLRSLFDAYEIALREKMFLLLLNRANKVIAFEEVSSGGMTGTVCDPKLVFLTAIKSGAAGLILAHNHPSGSLLPSNADTKITEKIRDAAHLFDINLLDHIILTDSGFYSFADETSVLSGIGSGLSSIS